MITWTPANRALLARATACIAINRAVGFPEDAAQTMTVINLAEGNGFLDIVGPIRGTKGALFVGNDNGTVDVSAWQINGAHEGLPATVYATTALTLWKARKWTPWVAWKNRAKNADWALFEEITAEAVKVSALPARYVEAKTRRKA